MTIERSAHGSSDFGRRRRAIHNAVAYQRRRSRCWRNFGIWGWYAGADIRGLVALDTITTIEFALAFRRHGEINLRLICDEDVRVEVYRAVRSIPTTLADQRPARYQSLKIAIAPMPTRMRSIPTNPMLVIEPLPMILS